MNVTAILLAGIFSIRSVLPAPTGSSEEEQRRRFLRVSVKASAHRSQGEYEPAAAALEQAYVLSMNAGLNHYHRQVMLRMALLKWCLGSVSESRVFFVKAGAAYDRAGDKRSAEFCGKCVELIRLYEEGKQARDSSLYYISLERFEQANSIGQDIGLLDFQVKCLRQESLVHWDMGRAAMFLESNRQALGIAERMNHRIERGRCLNNIGLSYHRLNEYSLAADYLENALEVIRAAGDHATEAECLGNLGILFRDLGNHSLSHFYLSAALAVDRQVGDRRAVAADLANLGSLLLGRGIETRSEADLAEGQKAFQESFSLLETESARDRLVFTTLNNIGIIRGEQGDPAEARRSFEEALKIVQGEGRALERGCALNNIAASYLEENNVSEALPCFRASYELGLEFSLENVVIESSFGLGRCFELAGDRERALDYYEKSVSALEGVRGRLSSEALTVGFLRGRLGAYHRAVGILAEQHLDRPSPETLGRIFDLMERAKARAFLENVWKAGVERATSPAVHKTERQIRLTANIGRLSKRLRDPDLTEEDRAALGHELEREEDEHFRLVADLRNARPEDGAGFVEEIVSLAEVRRRASDDWTAFLEYFLGDERSYLVLVTPDGADLFTLPGRAGIEGSTRGFIKLISEGSIDARQSLGTAERIGRELMPFDWQAKLGDVRKLVILPDGILHYLPFETVRVRAEGDPTYLVEACAVSYGPSASSLVALARRERVGSRSKELLALGGPARGTTASRIEVSDSSAASILRRLFGDHGDKFAPLPYSQREATDIAKLIPGDKVDLLIGNAASEDAVKSMSLEDYRILHFACHGLLDERRPLRSALVLAVGEGRENDGLLQMREIYGLRIRADLVVLSACQTARGSLEYAEGPMGLARSFFFSGARAVLATLWPVADKAGLILTREFYRQYFSGQSAGEALRLAKMKMIGSSWSHPYYWAGYALNGDPGGPPPRAKGAGPSLLANDEAPQF